MCELFGILHKTATRLSWAVKWNRNPLYASTLVQYLNYYPHPEIFDNNQNIVLILGYNYVTHCPISVY